MSKFWDNYWTFMSIPMLGLVVFFAGTMVGDMPTREEPFSTGDAVQCIATFLMYWGFGWAAGRESKK